MNATPFPKPPRRLPAVRQPISARSSRETAKDQATADALCAALVKALAKYSCEARGVGGVRCSRGPLDWAHGIGRGRGSKAVRWAHSNTFSLCRTHHEWFGHNEPAFDEWRLLKLGQVVFELVAMRAREIHRVDIKSVIWALRRGRFVQGERAA